MTAEGSLKSKSIAGISALLAVDIAICVAIVWAPLDNVPISAGVAVRIALVVLAPPVVYLLASLLSDETKAALVFWRKNNVLPSHRAFSAHLFSDHRIDVDRLTSKI